MGISLVIGGDHQNTLGVVEALGQKGIKSVVIVLFCSRSYVLKSKYVECGCIAQDKGDAINFICRYFDHYENTVPCIACSDDAAILLDENIGVLPKCLFVPSVKEHGTLSLWMQKQIMSETAEQLGLTVPKSWILKQQSSLMGVTFPCVTKPYTSANHGKRGFSVCINLKDLEEYLANLDNDEYAQIQEFIQKDYEFQYLGCSINNGGTIIIPGRTHIETASSFNNLTFLKYQQCADAENVHLLKMTKAFIRKTGYSGLFSVEFIHGKDGKDYFLEMNFRNDGNGIVVTASGTNLPYIWYLSCMGFDYLKELFMSGVETTYMLPEVGSFLSWINGGISFKEYKKQIQLTNCYLTYFKDDKNPFYSYISRSLKGIFVNIFVVILKRLHLYNFIKRYK